MYFCDIRSSKSSVLSFSDLKENIGLLNREYSYESPRELDQGTVLQCHDLCCRGGMLPAATTAEGFSIQVTYHTLLLRDLLSIVTSSGYIDKYGDMPPL
jgi:hypothetical protein